MHAGTTIPALTPILVVLALGYSARALAEDEPLPVSALRYRPAADSIYAISTEAVPAHHRLNRFMVRRLQYRGTVRAEFDVDIYTQHYFDLAVHDARQPSVTWAPSRHEMTDAGEMAYVAKLFDTGTAVAFLTRHLLEDRFLMFPVLPERRERPVRRGESWELKAPPFIFFEPTAVKIVTGKFDPHRLPRTIIRSTFEGWEEVDGRRCAVITFAFDVKPAEPKEGAQDGEIKYRGKSYFSPELGWPVVNVMTGDGFITDRDGRKETIVLRRKEVLIRTEGPITRLVIVKEDVEGAAECR